MDSMDKRYFEDTEKATREAHFKQNYILGLDILKLIAQLHMIDNNHLDYNIAITIFGIEDLYQIIKKELETKCIIYLSTIEELLSYVEKLNKEIFAFDKEFVYKNCILFQKVNLYFNDKSKYFLEKNVLDYIFNELPYNYQTEKESLSNIIKIRQLESTNSFNKKRKLKRELLQK